MLILRKLVTSCVEKFVMDEAEKRKNYFVVDVDFEKACDFVC